jgi:hypothetical protein
VGGLGPFHLKVVGGCFATGGLAPSAPFIPRPLHLKVVVIGNPNTLQNCCEMLRNGTRPLLRLKKEWGKGRLSALLGLGGARCDRPDAKQPLTGLFLRVIGRPSDASQLVGARWDGEFGTASHPT